MRGIAAVALCILGLASRAASASEERRLGPRAPRFSLENLGVASIEKLGTRLDFTFAAAKNEGRLSSSDLKRPGLALLLSATIPGMGQLYVGTHLRAGIYLGVEAAGWFGWNRLRGQGKDLEEEYKELADQFWDYARWKESSCFAEGGTHNIDETPQGNAVENDEYYENIGKYEQFNCGWESAVQGSRTADRNHYLDLRDDSNTKFRRASNFGTIVMLNHVLSAIDAVWSAKRTNDRNVAASVRVVPASHGGEYLNTLQMTLKW